MGRRPSRGKCREPRRAEAGHPPLCSGAPRAQRAGQGRPAFSPRGWEEVPRRGWATGAGAALNDHASASASVRGPEASSQGQRSAHSKPDGGRGGVPRYPGCVSTGKQTIEGKGMGVHGGAGGLGGGEAPTRPTKLPKAPRPGQVASMRETHISEIPPEWVDCEGTELTVAGNDTEGGSPAQVKGEPSLQ